MATYTWIKYANDSQGRGMSNDPTGKKFVGISQQRTSPNDSNNPDDYVWSPMK